jgi:hypothetical protein
MRGTSMPWATRRDRRRGPAGTTRRHPGSHRRLTGGSRPRRRPDRPTSSSGAGHDGPQLLLAVATAPVPLPLAVRDIGACPSTAPPGHQYAWWTTRVSRDGVRGAASCASLFASRVGMECGGADRSSVRVRSPNSSTREPPRYPVHRAEVSIHRWPAPRRGARGASSRRRSGPAGDPRREAGERCFMPCSGLPSSHTLGGPPCQ